jgi:hypothetical protein
MLGATVHAATLHTLRHVIPYYSSPYSADEDSASSWEKGSSSTCQRMQWDADRDLPNINISVQK